MTAGRSVTLGPNEQVVRHYPRKRDALGRIVKMTAQEKSAAKMEAHRLATGAAQAQQASLFGVGAAAEDAAAPKRRHRVHVDLDEAIKAETLRGKQLENGRVERTLIPVAEVKAGLAQTFSRLRDALETMPAEYRALRPKATSKELIALGQVIESAFAKCGELTDTDGA